MTITKEERERLKADYEPNGPDNHVIRLLDALATVERERDEALDLDRKRGELLAMERTRAEKAEAELAAWRKGNPSDDLWRVRMEQAERERDAANSNNATLRCQLDEAQIAALRAQDEPRGLTDEEVAGSFERMLDRRISFDPDGDPTLEPWEREDANHTINRLAAALDAQKAELLRTVEALHESARADVHALLATAERERDEALVQGAEARDYAASWRSRHDAAEARAAVMREALAHIVASWEPDGPLLDFEMVRRAAALSTELKR